MSKKSDLKFDNFEDFAKNNKSLIIETPVPARVDVAPNYAAIRAI